jgi:hypothetical protein
MAALVACAAGGNQNELSTEQSAPRPTTIDADDPAGRTPSVSPPPIESSTPQTPSPPTEPPGNAQGPWEIQRASIGHCLLDYGRLVEAEQWTQMREELRCILDDPAEVSDEALERAIEFDEYAAGQLAAATEPPVLVGTDRQVLAGVEE